MKPPQRRTSCIYPINNTNTDSCKIVAVLTLILPKVLNDLHEIWYVYHATKQSQQRTL
jgi:hypothetical protein